MDNIYIYILCFKYIWVIILTHISKFAFLWLCRKQHILPLVSTYFMKSFQYLYSSSFLWFLHMVTFSYSSIFVTTVSYHVLVGHRSLLLYFQVTFFSFQYIHRLALTLLFPIRSICLRFLVLLCCCTCKHLSDYLS